MPTPKAGYFLKDGTKVPGTTTICGAYKDAGGLIHWSWEQGRAGIKEPNLTEVANALLNAFRDGSGLETIKALLKEGMQGLDYRETRDKAADIGTLVHAAIEANIRGEAPPVMEEIPERAYRAFLKWQAQNNLEILEQEVQLVSEEFKYGGTLDAVGIADGKHTLLDWKTSKGVYKNYLLQLAAYAQLWNENYPDRKIEGGAWLVRFSKTDGICEPYFFTVEDLVLPFIQFTALREAYGLEYLIGLTLEKAKSCMKPL